MQERGTVANTLGMLSDDLHQMIFTDISTEATKDLRFGNGEERKLSHLFSE